MAREYDKPDTEIPPVIDFLKLVAKLIATWLTAFPDYLKAFVEWQSNPKLMLVDRNVALAACGYELLDILKWLFCLCPRTMVFYSRYDMPIEKENVLFTKDFGDELKPVREKDIMYDTLKDRMYLEKEMTYGLFINIFNFFCQTGGLKAVIDMISLEKFAEKANAAGLNNYKLPLDVIAMLLYPFKAIKSIAKPEVCKNLAMAGKSSFFGRVEQLEDKDIKDINKEQVGNAMSLMKAFLKLIHTEEEVAKIVLTHEMLLSLKFLQSTSLEKRLNGLADIKRMIDRVEPMSERHHFVESGETASWLNAEYLIKWIQSNKILEKILDENVHAELVKRISYILIFMAKKGAMTTSIIELLWKSQLEKHEDIVRVVYDTIKDIVEYLSKESIMCVHEKLKLAALESCDEKLIQFMKDYTLKAYARFEALKKKDGTLQDLPEPEPIEIERTSNNEITVPSSDSLLCVPKIWALLQDESPATQAMTELATNTFKELMLDNGSYKYRPQYFYLCIDNLKKNKSIQQSLTLATFILLIMNSQKKYHKVTVQEWVKRISKDYNLPDIILNNCQYYAKAVESAIAKGQKQANIGEAAIIGKSKHSSNLDFRFKFIEYLIKVCNDCFKFGKENLQKLWTLYVEESESEFDTKHFLNWLSVERDPNTMAPVSIFTQEENLALFEIICKSRTKLAPLDTLYYKCFSNCFKIVNNAANAIDTKRGRVRALKFDTIIGLDALWEIICNCQQESCRTKFCELLIDIYTNISEANMSKKKEMLANFINRCMSTIIKAEAREEEMPITNMVKLLIQYFDLVDGKTFDVQEDSAHKFMITVVNKQSAETKTIDVGIDITLGQIRRKIATAFKLPFNGFQITGMVKVYESDDDESKLRNLGWQHQFNIQKLPGDSNDDPKLLLAHNQDYIGHLFLLLSKESTSYVSPVWNLLTTLPPNKNMQNDIEALNIPDASKDGWNYLLDSKSVYKFLYSLQIVEGIVMVSNEQLKDEKAKKEKWLAKFVEKQGLIHLFTALIELPIKSLSNTFTRKCFSLLLKMLYMIQSLGYSFKEHIPKYEEKRENMIERVLVILEAFAEHSILPDSMKVMRTPRKQKSMEVENKKVQELKIKMQAPPIDPAELKEKKQQEAESKAFEYGFALIKGSQEEQFNYFDILLKVGDFKEFILKGLVLSDNPFLQDAFAQELISIYKSFKGKEYNETHAHMVLIPYMFKSMICETLNKETKCKKFYELLCKVVKDMKKAELVKLPMDFHAETAAIADYIKAHPIKENKSTDADYVIIGLLNLLDALLGKFPEEKENVGQNCGMINEILHQCLFDFPKSGNRLKSKAFLPPKCKSQESRQAAFNLMCTLACDTPKNLKQVLEYLTPIHANGAWRTKRMSDWNIIPETSEKSITGYVGMKNLGCICYMNSLLQQMYMIPSFRNDILAVEDPTKNVNPEENMLFQTQCLFSSLNESVKQYYNPKVFCHAFKDWEGKSINVLEQMDVDEFFNMFLDKLEFAIKGTPQANTIKHHFGGVFANQLLGKDCPHSSVREEPFLGLNLQVKNKKSLQQCLESFVEGEMLQGSNAYHCEKCDKKVTALKRVCIKKLPRYMICVLKRFDINYDTMSKFKINDYCEFPNRLNMEPFTEEGLAKKDKEKEREKAKKEGRDEDITSDSTTKPKYPPEYYDYKLTGVVIHLGTADAGHYYSLIMDREKENVPENERWYEFNDTLVDNYDPSEIKDDAFGGEERMASVEGLPRLMSRIRNAYLLVYERATPYDPPAEDEEEDKVNKAKVYNKETVIPPAIHNALTIENIKYWYSKYMFHEDYFEFALRLCLTWNSAENVLHNYPSRNNDYHLLNIKPEDMKAHAFQAEKAKFAVTLEERFDMKLTPEELCKLDVQVFKYAATILLTTLLRARSKTNVPDFIDVTKAYINKRVEAAQWLLSQFTNTKLIQEFLMESMENGMRRIAVGILYCSMLKAYEEEKKILMKSIEADKDSKCVLAAFSNCVFQQLGICRKHTIHFEQYFQLFSRLAFIGPAMREYLLRTGAVKRLLGFWSSNAETKWSTFTDIPYTENSSEELGLPSVIDERFQSAFEELLTLRREKINQEAKPSYTFLIEALSLLLRGTTIDEKQNASPRALSGCLNGVGMDAVTKSMLSDPKLICALINDSTCEIAYNAITECLVHISWENYDMKVAIVNGLIEGINVSEWEEIRKYFHFLKEILCADDPNKEKFYDYALVKLESVIKANSNSYYATFTIMKSILSVSYTHKPLADWYKKNPSQCDWAISWLTKNPFPANDSKEVKLFKSKERNMMDSIRNPGSLSQEEQNQWTSFTQSLAKHFESIKEGKPAEFAERPFIGDNLYYEKINKGQIIEVYDTRLQNWERHKVKRVMDEMIYVLQEELPEGYADWVEMDSTNIAFEGTHVKEKVAIQKSPSDDSPFEEDNEQTN